MLEHTLDRADQITDPVQKVTVITREHCVHALPQLDKYRGAVIVQPASRETAPAVFLGVTHVLAHDPGATLMLFPSDHFVYPEQQFVRVARTVVRAAARLKRCLFVLGVRPHIPEPDYGWIHQGPQLGSVDGIRVRTVKSFVEKPSLHVCEDAMRRGALWNTLVLAAKAATLWEIGWTCFPTMMRLFEAYRKAVRTPNERSVLEAIYRVMPSLNFSSDLLERTAAPVGVMELSGVLWSDWGKPERVMEVLRILGIRPVPPLAQAAVAAGGQLSTP